MSLTKTYANESIETPVQTLEGDFIFIQNSKTKRRNKEREGERERVGGRKEGEF